MTSTRIVLLVLLVGMVAWWLWLRSRPVEELDLTVYTAPEEFEETHSLQFLGGGDDGSVETFVEKEGDQYFLRRPLEDRADPTRFLESVRAARQLKVLRGLPDADPAEFGLEPPHHEFIMEAEGGATWTLAVGDSVPTGGKVYASTSTGPGVVVLRSFSTFKSFVPEIDDLRHPQVLPIRSPVVDSIEVIAGGRRLVAARESREEWWSRVPANLELAALPINRVIRQFRGPLISSYEPADVDRSRLGLDPPRATWIIHHNERSDTLWVGHPTPDQEEIYVRPARRDCVGRFPSDFYRDMVDGWPRLANVHLLHLGEGPVQSVTFLDPDGYVSWESGQSSQSSESVESVESEHSGQSAESGQSGSNAPAYVLADERWRREPGSRPVGRPQDLERDLENLLALQWREYPLDPPKRLEPELGLAVETATAAETLWIAPAESDSLVWVRSSRRDLWGETSSRLLLLWRYRLEHPDM